MLSFRFPSQPPRQYQFTCRGIDPERMKQSLENVSTSMPFAIRSAMRNFWFMHNGPEIVVEETFVLTSHRDDGEQAALGEHLNGVKFRFAGLAMASMTDLEVETLIAHEFAHGVFHREEVEHDLDLENAAIVEQFEAEAYLVAGDGQSIDEEAVKNVFRRQLKRRTDWIEAAVHKRILSWNPEYDDTIVRNWLAYYLKHNAPPPRATDEPEAPLPVAPAAASICKINEVNKVTEIAIAPQQRRNFHFLLMMLALLGLLVIGLWFIGVFSRPLPTT